MATIANLNVMLTASIGGFNATMKGAASTLQSVGGAVTEIGGKIFSLTGLVSALAGGAGFMLLVRNSMETIASTARLADSMGIATEKLSGLHYASKLAGVGAEELDGGLEKMLHSLGEAAAGGGEAGAAFEHLGLSAQQLAAMSPDKAFTAIAEGLKNIQNPAERTAVTMQIFGRSGAQLLPLLMKGAEGIKAAQAEAERLGVTFNRVDAAKVEAANASMKRMQAIFEGVAQTLAIQVAPFIEAAANKLTELGMSGDGAGKVVVNGFNTVLSTVAELADYLNVVEAGWQMLRSGASFAIGGIVDGIGYVLDALSWLAKKLGLVEKGFGDYAHTLAKGFYDTGKEAFQKAGEDWDAFNNRTNSKAAARAIADIQAASEKNAKAIADNAEKMRGAGAASEDWAAKLKLAQENAKKVVETLTELHKQVDTFGMSEGQKKLFDLKALGASPEQLAEAQKLIDQIAGLENAKKAADLIAETQKAVQQFNMTDSQKKLADIQLAGVSPEQLEQARAALAQLDALNEQKKKMEEGKSIFESTRTPMEKYTEQIDKLNDLLNGGAINWDTYGRAVRKAREELEQAAASRSPELFRNHSAEADKYLYEQQHARAFDVTAGVQKTNPNKDEIPKLQYSEAYQSRLILQRIENKLTDANNDPTETIDIA
jgi:hypothetical protein